MLPGISSFAGICRYARYPSHRYHRSATRQNARRDFQTPNPPPSFTTLPCRWLLRWAGEGGLAGAFRCGAYIWLIITIIICVRLSKLTSDLIDMHRPVEFLASAQRKIVSGNRLGLIEALLCDCHIHARMQSVPLENVCKLRDPHIAIVHPYTIVCYITRMHIRRSPDLQICRPGPAAPARNLHLRSTWQMPQNF